MNAVCVVCGSSAAPGAYAALPLEWTPGGERNTVSFCSKERHRAQALEVHGLLLDVVAHSTRARGKWVNKKKKAYRKAWGKLKEPGPLPPPAQLEGGCV